MTITAPVLILGMHRSGTSCLTGCLEEAGLYLGDVNTEADFNKKGNRENRDIMEHHDRILARVGASWDKPPAIDPDWTQDEKNQLSSLLKGYDNIAKWGLKDPRTIFLLGGWRHVTKLMLVGTFRHPYEVASSLVHRSEAWKQPMDMETAYALWAAYNRKMISVHQAQPFDIIRYDISPRLYNLKLISLALKLGLNPVVNNSFREETLHNHHRDEQNVPEGLKSIWESLNDLAI